MIYRFSILIMCFISTLAPASYPMSDVPDLPIDILDAVEKVVKLQKEIEKYRVYRQQIKHHYAQATKLKQSLSDLSTLRVQGFQQILSLDIFEQVMSFKAGEEDLQEWLRLVDGATDLQHQLGVFRSRFEEVFEELADIGGWDFGAFQLDEAAQVDFGKVFAQHAHDRAALLQAYAHLGEGKHSHQVEGHKLSRAMNLWQAYQEDSGDLSGTQRGLDTSNAQTYALQEVQHKRMRALQGIVTLQALERARQGYRQETRLKEARVLMETMNQAADAWVGIGDDVMR